MHGSRLLLAQMAMQDYWVGVISRLPLFFALQ
jgi:hypothetical protein